MLQGPNVIVDQMFSSLNVTRTFRGWMFHQGTLSVDLIIKKFSKTLHVPATSLPRHNSSTQLPSELPSELLSAPLVWVCRGSVIPPLQSLYDVPTPFCAMAPAPSPSESGHRMRSSLSAALRHARQRTPHLAARVAAADRWVRAQAVLPLPSGSRFQTHWFLRLHPRLCHKTVPEPCSYPGRRFCTPGTGGTCTASTDAVPIPSVGTAQEVRPMTSSPSS
jgi:hypothetical protein